MAAGRKPTQEDKVEAGLTGYVAIWALVIVLWATYHAITGSGESQSLAFVLVATVGFLVGSYVAVMVLGWLLTMVPYHVRRWRDG